MQLDRVVRFGGGYVGSIDPDGRSIVRGLGIAAPAHLGRLVIGNELEFDVGSGHVRIHYLNGCGRGRCVLERLGDDERHVLPVIANDVVGKRWPRLVDRAGFRRGLV